MQITVVCENPEQKLKNSYMDKILEIFDDDEPQVFIYPAGNPIFLTEKIRNSDLMICDRKAIEQILKEEKA